MCFIMREIWLARLTSLLLNISFFFFLSVIFSFLTCILFLYKQYPIMIIYIDYIFLWIRLKWYTNKEIEQFQKTIYRNFREVQYDVSVTHGLLNLVYCSEISILHDCLVEFKKATIELLNYTLHVFSYAL